MKKEEKSRHFGIGFFRAEGNEELFLSVTPGFEHGPGILRDGITNPRMTDPHHVAYVRGAHSLCMVDGQIHHTSDSFLQRAGTWTLYQHIKQFVNYLGDKWQIVACQSCGDLTMNPWHVAYLGKSHLPAMKGKICALHTDEDIDDYSEPIKERVYHTLVKWLPAAVRVRGRSYEFLDVRFLAGQRGVAVVISDKVTRGKFHELFSKMRGYNSKAQDISKLIEFCLSGKPIAESGVELCLSNSIDRFQDIRHVFKVPTVPCNGNFRGQDVKTINFGEYQLYRNLNERRAALQCPVLIDLNIDNNITIDWSDVKKTLLRNHFHEVPEPDSPTRRGQFRRYPNSNKVEIFYPHNVYPFGVLGLSPTGLVCLASGGLSGRVGNTLEGITRIMYDFFGCEDAIVLDEGFDTFHLVNPVIENGNYRYKNEDILSASLEFTKRQINEELKESRPHDGLPMDKWPLNEKIFKEIRKASSLLNKKKVISDIFVVPPYRSQIRSVLIFARKVSAKAGRRKRAKSRGK